MPIAGFIFGAPAMNLLTGELTEGGAAVRLHAGPVIPFATGGRAGPDGHPVTVGIRPEHLTIGQAALSIGPDASGRPDVQTLNLLVDLVEPLGSETLVHGRLSDAPTEEAATWEMPTQEMPVQEIVVRLPGHAPFGERLPLRLVPEHLHLFDRSSGRRMPGT